MLGAVRFDGIMCRPQNFLLYSLQSAKMIVVITGCWNDVSIDQLLFLAWPCDWLKKMACD